MNKSINRFIDKQTVRMSSLTVSVLPWCITRVLAHCRTRVPRIPLSLCPLKQYGRTFRLGQGSLMARNQSPRIGVTLKGTLSHTDLPLTSLPGRHTSAALEDDVTFHAGFVVVSGGSGHCSQSGFFFFFFFFFFAFFFFFLLC